MKKRICVVTGCRSDYGLLKPLLDKIYGDGYFDLQIIATGAHLSSKFGLTYRQIEKDGFKINEKVNLFLKNDNALDITKSVGLGLGRFSDAFMKLSPDLVVVLGDRFEIFSAASAAFLLRLPIVHLYGGELTEGSIDDGLRHAISKFSLFHFCSTQTYRKRLIQLGENPAKIFNVGALGIDNIRNLKLLDRRQLENSLKFNFGEKSVLVTFYPSTKEINSTKKQFSELLAALSEFRDLQIIFTKPAIDINASVISGLIDKYIATHSKNAIGFLNLGQLRYLSVIKQVDAVVGNSSSGLIEVPSLARPTVNIGNRQKGRIAAQSVINCASSSSSIVKALKLALTADFKDLCKKIKNPYGDGHAAESIYKILKERVKFPVNINKTFYDLEGK
ncbi:MAG: UDP-N-acetylglucosamine 2-epimerase [Candidatus Omnitrophota bacterium]